MESPGRRVDQDVRGGSSRGTWTDVEDAQWTDWRWQHRHRITTLAELETVIEVTDAGVTKRSVLAVRFVPMTGEARQDAER